MLNNLKSSLIFLFLLFNQANAEEAPLNSDNNSRPTQKTVTDVADGVNFKNLKDGDTINQNSKVSFEVFNMTVHPAGELIENTGHHHLIINGDFIPEGEVIPATPNHIHFGKGQTETTLNLPPGEYKITLQFADGAHRSYGKRWSKTIKIKLQKN